MMATESIVRERLGEQETWTQGDSGALGVALRQLHDAVEKLHDYELENADEPAFALEFGDTAL
jgi:hypothetical protein